MSAPWAELTWERPAASVGENTESAVQVEGRARVTVRKSATAGVVRGGA
eukprot:CAMPEP_0204198290 /NCGR_PEP_ID=MMETSP0361-20130328/65176_1 /ASSEMBLY_ACC=CAM_ASM_000343 /TAXON_ID=268821 /ORGANISM="Scrippsiella Hangoei, Strain SHTV-5" /LENGTH=48 /DNA_ID= /DNA_START= /DNA_END= /DNA_ORIENTATION=